MLCAILDDQSTTSFIDPYVMEFFGLESPTFEYSLTTLAQSRERMSGKKAIGLKISGAGLNNFHVLPEMFTSERIPDTRDEVVSTVDVRKIKHLAHLAKHFPGDDGS